MQRNRRLLNNNSDTKKYEKTFNGFIMRMYRMFLKLSGIND